MHNDVVRWGVLGCADIALRRVIPAIQATSSGRVVAIGSRDLQRAQATAQSLGIARAYGSYLDVLRDAEVEAVYIPLPNTLHAEWTVRAADHHKHVLCEKPMAPSVAECERMVAACRRAGVRLMEGFMYRFHPQHARVRELVASGAIGTPTLIRSSFCVHMRRPPEDIRFSPTLGGGALLDVGVYAIDAVRWLTGSDPLSVVGQVALDSRGVDMSATASLAFADDLLASVVCSFVADGGGSYEVLGRDGRITVHQAFAQPVSSPARVTWPGGEEVFEPNFNQHVPMIEAFASALRTGAPPPIADDAGVGNIRVIESLRRPA